MRRTLFSLALIVVAIMVSSTLAQPIGGYDDYLDQIMNGETHESLEAKYRAMIDGAGSTRSTGSQAATP